LESAQGMCEGLSDTMGDLFSKPIKIAKLPVLNEEDETVSNATSAVRVLAAGKAVRKRF
jgi:hypothetical protein